MPNLLKLLPVALLLSCLTPVSAHALSSAPGDTASSVVLDANFNSDTIGSSPNLTLPGAPAGDFLTLNQTAGTVTVVASIDGLTQKPVEMKQNNNAGGVGLSAWLAPTLPGLERVTVRWSSLARDANPVALLRCAIQSATGTLASVDYRPHGTLTYNLGSELPIEYQNNRSQQFTVVVDFLAGTTSLSIDGAPVAGFQDVPFVEPGSGVSRIEFAGDEDHPQGLVMDDISAVAFTRDPDVAPSLTAPGAVDGEEDGTLTFQVQASDPDGDPIALTADLTGLPAGNDATFTPEPSNELGTFLWHMQEGDAGQYLVTFQAATQGATATAETIVNVAERGISVTGSLIWTPGPGSEGSYVVTFTAIDQFGDTGSSQTTIDVFSAPTLLAPAPDPNRSGDRSDLLLSPGAIQKGPVVSGPTRVSATVGKTSVVTVTATDTTGTSSSSAASFASIRSPERAAGRSTAPPLTLTADLTNLPAGHNAVFVVDRDPFVLVSPSVTAEAGVPLSLPVLAGDPDLDPILSLTADLTDLPDGHNASFTAAGGNGSGTLSWTPDVGDAGDYDVVFTAANELVGTTTTRIHVRAGAPARVYMPNNKKVRLASNKMSDCVYLEPVDGSFDLLDLDFTSVRMISPGTGSVASIPAISGKTIVIGDRDRNLVEDVQLCFTRNDLRLLFSDLRGNHSVPVTIEAQLNSGRLVAGAVILPIAAGNGSFQASVSPNPLNPIGTLRFLQTRPGAVRITLFDLNGRLARVLLDSPGVTVGDHTVVLDGRDGQGRKLASGIYFYRIEGSSGVESGRFVIAK